MKINYCWVLISPQSWITIAAWGSPDIEPILSIAFTVGKPSITFPKTTCFPFNHGVVTVLLYYWYYFFFQFFCYFFVYFLFLFFKNSSQPRQHNKNKKQNKKYKKNWWAWFNVIKNWEPFVFGPELAILKYPGAICFNIKFSSLNFSP